jgi:hypothetical protein
VTRLGNTTLRPERSQEIEGGLDANLWNSRLTFTVTQYRNMRHNALVDIDVAQSVYGGGRIQTNVGLIRKSGTEVTVGARLISTGSIGWNVNGSLSKSNNRVLRLAPGQLPIVMDGGEGVSTRIVPGYPLFSRWAIPVASYRDADGNGRIDATEVLLADSAVYIGPEDPNFAATLNTDLSLGQFSAHATLAYTDGLTQYNSASQGMSVGLYDPSAPLGAQAAAVTVARLHSGYGLVETVNTLRFQSLSINYNVPFAFVRRFGLQSMAIALQGSNLGLRTNYRGKDPNVNAFATGNSTADTGQLPQPRTWALRFALAY